MKKITLILMVIALMLNLVSCNDKRVETVDSVVTKKYDLDELRSFFEDEELPWYSNYVVGWDLDEVNQRFPLEFKREDEQYGVYAVEQGGYYYVFWGEAIITKKEGNIYISTGETITAIGYADYLTPPKKKTKYKSFKPGVTTAEDVIANYPSSKFRDGSSGIYSHSYIDDENILVVHYGKHTIPKYSDMVIETIEVRQREEAGSEYSMIRTEDLPK